MNPELPTNNKKIIPAEQEGEKSSTEAPKPVVEETPSNSVGEKKEGGEMENRQEIIDKVWPLVDLEKAPIKVVEMDYSLFKDVWDVVRSSHVIASANYSTVTTEQITSVMLEYDDETYVLVPDGIRVLEFINKDGKIPSAVAMIKSIKLKNPLNDNNEILYKRLSEEDKGWVSGKMNIEKTKLFSFMPEMIRNGQYIITGTQSAQSNEHSLMFTFALMNEMKKGEEGVMGQQIAFSTEKVIYDEGKDSYSDDVVHEDENQIIWFHKEFFGNVKRWLGWSISYGNGMYRVEGDPNSPRYVEERVFDMAITKNVKVKEPTPKNISW